MTKEEALDYLILQMSILWKTMDPEMKCALEIAIKAIDRSIWRDPEGNPPEVKDGESDYIMLRFANFNNPAVGDYREDKKGGAYYIGDDLDPCISYGLIVDGWQPMPERE